MRGAGWRFSAVALAKHARTKLDALLEMSRVNTGDDSPAEQHGSLGPRHKTGEFTRPASTNQPELSASEESGKFQMEQQSGFKWKAREQPGRSLRSRKENLHDSYLEIRDEIHHDRGKDQPPSKGTLI